MAWTSPMTAVANATFTAAQFNTHVRDNLNETAPAKATAANQYFVATGLNAIAARSIGQLTENVIGTTTSTSYTATLSSGSGPSIAVTTGTAALIGVWCHISNSTAGQMSFMGYDVSGASSVAANDTRSVACGGTSGTAIKATGWKVLTGLTAGSNTFAARYRVNGGTGTFDDRSILVMPL